MIEQKGRCTHLCSDLFSLARIQKNFL
jgi:hypothetical protein